MLYAKIEKEYRHLEKSILKVEAKLKKAPAGYISCLKNGKGYKWFFYGTEKRGHYLSKKNRSAAVRLVQKTYNTLYLKQLKDQKETLGNYLRKCSKSMNKLEKYISNPEVCRLLYADRHYENEDLAEWENADYERSTDHPESLTVRSISGHLVRSKSEAIIDMALAKHNIPHRYEDKLEIADIVLHPDFTIRHPKTGEYFIWEHFGLMDDNFYMSNAYSKMKLYSSYGYFPMINLIITCETKEEPLDIELVEKLIEHFFM